MPVIGRLDQQVSDMLIEPIGQQRARDAHVAPATPHDVPSEATTEASPRGEDRQRAEEPLPVWLL